MRVHRGDQATDVAALNLTSMIDCCFLLLIFFVSTLKAPKIEANMPAYLPKTPPVQKGAGADLLEPKKEESNTVHIALHRAGGSDLEVFLNGAKLEGGFSRLNGALAALRHVVRETPGAKTEIVIDADRVVAYRHVVTTLDLCARHHFASVSFAMPAKDEARTP